MIGVIYQSRMSVGVTDKSGQDLEGLGGCDSDGSYGLGVISWGLVRSFPHPSKGPNLPRDL